MGLAGTSQLGWAALGWAIGLAVALSWTVPARAQSPWRPASVEARQQALALHDEAKELYLAGRYREAQDKLRAAVALDPRGKLLYYNLGLVAEKIGDLDEAIRHYEQLLRLEKDPREKKRVERDLARVRGALQHESWSPRGPTTHPGQRHAPTGPGTSPSDSATLPWAYAAAATAGACLAAGGILAVRAASLAPGPESATGPEVSVDDLREDAEQAHSTAVAADVLLAVGALAGIGAVTLALSSASDGVAAEQTSKADAAVGLELGPARWRIWGRF